MQIVMLLFFDFKFFGFVVVVDDCGFYVVDFGEQVVGQLGYIYGVVYQFFFEDEDWIYVGCLVSFYGFMIVVFGIIFLLIELVLFVGFFGGFVGFDWGVFLVFDCLVW